MKMFTKALFRLINLIIIGHILNSIDNYNFNQANSLTSTTSPDLTTTTVVNINNTSGSYNDSILNNNELPSVSEYSSRAANIGDTFNDSTTTFVLNHSPSNGNNDNNVAITIKQQHEYQTNNGQQQQNYYPSNHRNHYPPEPYPSASYTSLVTSSPQQNGAGNGVNNNNNNNQHQQMPSNHQLMPLLNRDHHSSINIGYPQHYDYNSYNDTMNATTTYTTNRDSNLFTNNDSYNINKATPTMNYDHNSFDIVASRIASSALASIPNTSSASNSSSSNLLQNLTSSLFGTKQLTNATLQTLSELLNKTKQTISLANNSNNQQQYNSSPFYSTTSSSSSPTLFNGNINYNGHKPTSNLSNLNDNNKSSSQQATFYTKSQPIATSGSSNLNTYQAIDSIIGSGGGPTQSGLISDTYSLFDYIRPNQFGLREPYSAAKYQQQASNYYRQGRQPTQVFEPSQSSSNSYSQNNRPTYNLLPSGQNHHNNHNYNNNQHQHQHQLPPTSAQQYSYSQQGNKLNNDYHQNNALYKTSSNIYNTYMPYKDSLNSMPTITNGQTLAMAIYDNILDNGFRLPSLSTYNNYKSAYQSSISDYNQLPLNSNSNSNGQAQSTISSANGGGGVKNNYHYIQQHNTNNQNHLDKVVYHSTPFRPSIVSPPPASSLATTTTTTSTTTGAYNMMNTTPPSSSSTTSGSGDPTPGMDQSSLTLSTEHRQQQQQQQNRQKSADNGDNKSISFASLSSSSSTISDSKPEYSTNGQAMSGNRLYSSSGSSKLASSGKLQNNGNSSDKQDLSLNNNKSLKNHDSNHDNNTNNNNNRTSNDSTTSSNNNNNNSFENNNNFEQHYYDDKRQNNNNFNRSTLINTNPITAGHSILFDLYEREIDNQIRESLYGEVVHNSEHLLDLTSSRPYQSTGLWPSTAATSLYTDPTDSDSIQQTLANSNWPLRVAQQQSLPSSSQASSQSSLATSSSASLNPLLASSSQNYQQLNNNPFLSQTKFHAHSDPLAAALQELPTFSAADLQPIFPAGPAYSLLPAASSTHQDSYPASSSGSLEQTTQDLTTLAFASQLFPHFNQHQLGSLLEGGDFINTTNNKQAHSMKSNNNKHKHYKNGNNYNQQHDNHQAAHQSTSNPLSQTNIYGTSGSYLPSILFKLHSSPLSSILSNPLTHFYSNNKLNKEKKKLINSTNNHQQASSSSQNNQFTFPTSFLANQLSGGKNIVFGLFNNNKDNLNTSPSSASIHLHHHNNNNNDINNTNQNNNNNNNEQKNALDNQQAAALAAAATASLIAAAAAAVPDNSLSPLQAALIQAQASSSSSALNAAELTDLINHSYHSNHNYNPTGVANGASTTNSLTSGAQQALNQAADQQALSRPSVAAASFGGFGLTGGGLTPMIWRNILSPTLWTRKQSGTTNSPTTSSGQINNNNNNHHHHHHHQQQQASTTSSISPFTSPNNNNNHQHHQGSHKMASSGASLAPSIHFGASKYTYNQPTMFGSNSLAAYLFNMPSNSAPIPQIFNGAGGGGASSIGSLKRPRLKIKILKIPVAFYDQPASSRPDGVYNPVSAASLIGSGSGSASGLHTTILPAQFQTNSLAASLLTSIPCPLSHNSPQLPHSLEQHLLRDQAASSSFAEAALALGALLPPTATATASATMGLGTQAAAATGTPSSSTNNQNNNNNNIVATMLPATTNQLGTQSNQHGSTLQQHSIMQPARDGTLLSSTVSTITPTTSSQMNSNHNNNNDSFVESPLSINGAFTDINQPNDLQVSPSDLQSKSQKISQLK